MGRLVKASLQHRQIVDHRLCCSCKLASWPSWNNVKTKRYRGTCSHTPRRMLEQPFHTSMHGDLHTPRIVTRGPTWRSSSPYRLHPRLRRSRAARPPYVRSKISVRMPEMMDKVKLAVAYLGLLFHAALP